MEVNLCYNTAYLNIKKYFFMIIDVQSETGIFKKSRADHYYEYCLQTKLSEVILYKILKICKIGISQASGDGEGPPPKSPLTKF